VSLVEQEQDIKGAIRIRNSKKDKQHNAKRKKTNNDLQIMHIKLKIEEHETR
jgi:hypothetical protein